MKLLHGELEVEVVSGENLYDRDKAFFHIIPGDWSDAWVQVQLGGNPILTTGVRKNAINAVWGERVTLPVCEEAEYLDVSVWDKDHLRSQSVGRARVMLGDPDKPWNKDGPIYLEEGKGRINMKIHFTPAAQAEEESIEVPRCYFPMRTGGSMKLYQDAHVVKVPGISGGGDSLFGDIADTLRKAKKFIYIAAWSVWTGTRLERDQETLGELLKQKAKEGVRVLLLIWNEKFSSGLCAGLVGTYDEDTAKYFHKSGVYVGKVRRKKSSAPAASKVLAETAWTHHQKLIVADKENGDLVAYFGGLDLTRGRFDTPDHELFNTLSGEHRGDFHNGYISVDESQGPREPWHDIHAKVTGHAAIDLLRNFEERWRNQLRDQSHLLVQSYDEASLNGPQSREETDGTTWEMQVVRSIDNDSADFNSGRVTVLDSADGNVVDTSLHRAAVRVIRQAQKFLYIENQYFIGSAQAWREDQRDVCARNLVPLEIAHKIVNKIRAGEGFRVYLVVPLLPEGNVGKPIAKCSVSTILHFQFLTIQMIYRKIGEALKEAGSSHHPTDYFLVLFLGKKESPKKVVGAREPRQGSDEWAWRQKARFPIYVHSKMMIADDSLTLVGSANFNQRSLDGTKDTEVSVAARQVRKTSSSGESGLQQVTDGAVGALRRSLWAEHTSGLSEENTALADPSSLTAIRELKTLADEALESYARGPADEEIRCRFLRYPLEVSPDGSVGPREDMPHLPDFGVPAVGCRGRIPSVLTV